MTARPTIAETLKAQIEAHLAPAGVETAQKLGLLPEEYAKICEYLGGRQPNFTELSIYSVMWSEHCSYKNSILQLKTLPKAGERVMAAAGEENAGLLDIGQGWAVAFKIESHNHPSAIEPYQGAATGVGGIHRDIFTMGARPIAALNSLRFGDPTDAKTRRLVRGVVSGIGGYGNSFGVPTVGGEVYFDPCYHTNPLVNAMSVGVVRHGQTVSATALGVGNPVFIVGSATGKDGIHGATFASADITENSAESLPAVQVGDPFQEKLLLEATLEAVATGAVIGMQDMGAAGITCSTSEMSAKGQVGMKVWLDRVPTRQASMLPFEILLSESQERMLIVCEKGRESELLHIYEKWDLPCVQIGEVTEGDTIHYYYGDQLVAEVNANSLVLGGGAPIYTREQREPAYFAACEAFDVASIPVSEDLLVTTEALLQLPSIASKRWIRRQYDSMVGAATATSHRAAAAATVHVHGSDMGLAMSVDCNSRYVRNHPERGCALAVAEAARNLACTGAEPLGVTNCLNFGNPYNPEVYWQFAGAIRGMKLACEAFGLPVTGGNVSFYNQSEDGPVHPTPTIGMVGLLQDVRQMMTLDFKTAGDQIFLLGNHPMDLGSSAYLYHLHGVLDSPAPHLDLAAEQKLQQLLLNLIGQGVVQSANDVSDGGLMITLLESGFPSGKGFALQVEPTYRADAFWFGEAGGRAVVSVKPAQAQALLDAASATGVPCLLIGTVTEGDVTLPGHFTKPIQALQAQYDTALERALGV